MSKIKQRKTKLFRLFSQNLEWVKEHPSIELKPDFSNGYICPICLDVFFEKDLDSTAPNPLTFEDIPPASLGGKPLALTCKKCNSESGHKLDNHLLKYLLATDALSFLPNSTSQTSFERDGIKVNGTVEIDGAGVCKLNLEPGRSNPVHASQFQAYMRQPPRLVTPAGEGIFSFKINYYNKANERRAEIALLRIGYLLAFATFGNGFLINAGLYKVREQILHPDKTILPHTFWIKYDFPKEMEGVNIIALPGELQCFLAIFSLTTGSQSRRFAIALPGPSSPGLQVYDFINEILCTGDGSALCNGIVEKIPSRNYLHEKQLAFACHSYWQKFTRKDYKPT